MAALTADAPLRIFGEPVTKQFPVDSSIAQTWYKGEAFVIDQSADTVNVTPVHDLTHPNVAATDVFVGIAMGGGVNAISVAEDYAHGVDLYIEPTVVGFKSTVFTNADVGGPCYYPVSLLAAVGSVADCPYIGKIMFVEDGFVYVQLLTQICSGA